MTEDYLATLQRAKDNNILFFSDEELTPYLRACMDFGEEHKILRLTRFSSDLLPGWDVEWL